jgi:hypothetical protein
MTLGINVDVGRDCRMQLPNIDGKCQGKSARVFYTTRPEKPTNTYEIRGKDCQLLLMSCLQ